MSSSAPSVAVIGGGLAGLAAATALAENGVRVELFEARRSLGGRAGSFRDPETGEWIDHCQHVGMGCCTNLRDFLQRTGCQPFLRRYETLHFIGTDGRQSNVRAARGWPAPLHLAGSFLRLKFLPLRDRVQILWTLGSLARSRPVDRPDSPTIGEWLRTKGTSAAAINRFWSVVLVSALGESIERASLSAARKVFVDGFMAAREAYVIDVPTVPLGQLYDETIARWLRERGVAIHLESAVRELQADATGITGLIDAAGREHHTDRIIVAVPWRRVSDIVPPPMRTAMAELNHIDQIASSPISAVHLWFDRPITDLPHAVIVGRLSQWLFRHEARGEADAHYYQVVVSASHELAGRSKDDVLAEVVSDLVSIWPTAKAARLLRSRVVTQREAVFSVRPGLDQQRPRQTTSIPGLFLAGDWTNTGWPSTMEGAVRSGYLAAEAVLSSLERPRQILVPDLRPSWLARWLIRRT